MMAYEEVVNWFEKEAELYPKRDHTDETFVNLTFEQRALSLRRTIQKLQAESLNLSRIQQEYTFLTYIFKVEVSSFERKQYQNFSHASNKSMNLNSYIDVLGKSFKESITEKGRILEECSSEQATHTFLDSPYIAVLDADSVLSYDYASRLIYEMEQPNFQNVAVIQTPYSAFPKPPGALERVAGATTDMQYLIHQGFSHFGATFWVGANALIRKKALEDIVEQRVENGYLIKRYVQDRTVIEDTESSIDLADKGWQLYNYPERLSYSATPPDFGSLIIQRKRWANGGLIILPKLIRYLLKNPFHFNKLKECFFRIHYLISIPAILLSTFWMQLSSYSLLDFPLESLLLTSPYLTLYGRDMRQYGYRYSDLLRVTALNLILLPVNLAGVLQSFKQILFGKHTRFFRTPKISGTTPIPLPYLFGEIFLFLYTFWIAMEKNRPESAFITLFFFYGLFYLIGMKDSLKELLYIQKLKASVFSRPFLKKQKESQLAIE
jgi:cellulose synthase (UDP-forming)